VAGKNVHPRPTQNGAPCRLHGVGVQQYHGGRDKKLVYALETYSQFGRISCSECNDRLRKKRNCRRPGEQDMQQDAIFRFTSPLLYERNAGVLRECPVGYVLRNAPHVNRAVNAQSYAENGALNPLDCPTWLQQAMTVVSSERTRLREMKDTGASGKSDSNYGQRVLRGRR
jgi:hypothetical protein